MVTQTKKVRFTATDYCKNYIFFLMPCCKSVAKYADRKGMKRNLKQEKIFQVGKERTNRMIDVIGLVKRLQKLDLLFNASLTKRQ